MGLDFFGVSRVRYVYNFCIYCLFDEEKVFKFYNVQSFKRIVFEFINQQFVEFIFACYLKGSVHIITKDYLVLI